MKKAIIRYEKDKNYNLYHPTDAFGSVSPRGELIVNLSQDLYDIPDYEVFQVSPEGVLDDKSKIPTYINKKVAYDKEGKPQQVLLKRVMLCTLAIPMQSAIDLSIWILKKVIDSKRYPIDKEKLLNEITKLFGANNGSTQNKPKKK